MAARSAPVVHRMPITKVRNNLGALARRVHIDKDSVIIEKDGFPVMALVDIDAFEDYLDQSDPKVRASIRTSDRQYRAGRSRAARGFLGELEAVSGPRKPPRRPAP